MRITSFFAPISFHLCRSQKVLRHLYCKERPPGKKPCSHIDWEGDLPIILETLCLWLMGSQQNWNNLRTSVIAIFQMVLMPSAKYRVQRRNYLQLVGMKASNQQMKIFVQLVRAQNLRECWYLNDLRFLKECILWCITGSRSRILLSIFWWWSLLRCEKA